MNFIGLSLTQYSHFPIEGNPFESFVSKMSVISFGPKFFKDYANRIRLWIYSSLWSSCIQIWERITLWVVCDEVIIVLFSFQACFINNFLQLRNVFNRVIIDFDRDFLGMFWNIQSFKFYVWTEWKYPHYDNFCFCDNMWQICWITFLSEQLQHLWDINKILTD